MNTQAHKTIARANKMYRAAQKHNREAVKLLRRSEQAAKRQAKLGLSVATRLSDS